MTSPLLSTQPARAAPTFNKAVGSKVVGAGNSTAQSRSTSAGSSLSEGHDALNLQKLSQARNASVESSPIWSLSTPLYAADSFELPLTSQFPVIDRSSPLLVTSTVPGVSILQPQSLESFYEEYKAKSSPASGISLPPGLEDLVDPEGATARLMATEAFLECKLEMEALSEVQMDAANQFQEWLDAQWDSSAEAQWVDYPFSFEAQQFFASSMEEYPSMWDSSAEALDMRIMQECVSHNGAVAFDSQFILSEMQQPHVWDVNAEAFDMNIHAPSDLLTTWLPEEPHVQHGTEIGSLECPTVGSQVHHLGTCTPCAFVYSKGCGNGVMCAFCHLCDQTERKRRSKGKRAAKQSCATGEIRV